MINNKFIEKYNWDVSKVTALTDLEPLLEQVKDDVTIPFNPSSFKVYTMYPLVYHRLCRRSAG